MSNSSQNCVIPRFIRYKKKKEITNRWIRDITIYIFARLIKETVLGSPTSLPPTLESCSCAYMGWRDLCDWRHSFPRTKLLPKAGVRFIRYTRGETGPLDGAWRRDASHTLATKRPLPSSYKMARAPILGVFFLSIAPFLPLFSPPFLLPLFVHKQLRTCSFLCILSSILFSLPFKPPNVPPSFYSVSFPFPSFRLLLSSSSRSPPRGVLYPLHFPFPPSLFLASYDAFPPSSAPSVRGTLSLRANSLRAISCI